MSKSVTERVAALRERAAAVGLKRLELYAHPEDWVAIKALADKLKKRREKAAVGSPVERGVGRHLPSAVFVVLDELGIPVFCAAYPQACNEHISDAIVEYEIHSAGLWVVREYTLDTRTRSEKLADAGFTRRPSLRAMDMREALELIAAPMRPDGTWNRDREACRELAAEALGRYDDSEPHNAEINGPRPQAEGPR